MSLYIDNLNRLINGWKSENKAKIKSAVKVHKRMIKEQENRPDVHDMLSHPWLMQFEEPSRTNNQSSFIDNRLDMDGSLKERIIERGLETYQGGDFARHLIAKMSWISQSQ